MDNDVTSDTPATREALRSSVLSSDAFKRLSQEQQEKVRAQIDNDSQQEWGGATALTYALAVQALGGDWPERARGGRSNDPSAPLQRSLVPQVEAEIDGRLRTDREGFSAAVLDLMLQGWPQ